MVYCRKCLINFSNEIYFYFFFNEHVGVYSTVGLTVTEYTPSYYD